MISYAFAFSAKEEFVANLETYDLVRSMMGIES
jgi:hypothetical protein